MSGAPEQAVRNPLTDREQTIIDANTSLNGGPCPNDACDKHVDVCDLTDAGDVYIVHEEDPEPGFDTRGEDHACRIDPQDLDLDG